MKKNENHKNFVAQVRRTLEFIYDDVVDWLNPSMNKGINQVVKEWTNKILTQLILIIYLICNICSFLAKFANSLAFVYILLFSPVENLWSREGGVDISRL